jgi:hypothetical protein
MNKNTIIYVGICIAMLCTGILVGYFSYPKPDPSIDLEYEQEKRILREQAQLWMDSANYYKERIDTIIIERQKLKTIKQYEKGLASASLDSVQQLLLARPTVE